MSTERQFDWELVNPDAQEPTKESFPYLQWHHGKSDLEELGEEDVRFRGGWLFNLTQKANRFGDDFTLPGFKSLSVKLGRDKQPCLGAPSARFAILRRRFCWMQKDDRGREIFFSAIQNKHRPGFIGKVQFLAIPAGIEAADSAEHLFILTAKATAGMCLQEAVRDHRDLILPVANKTAPAGRKLPPYALYTHIGAANHVMKGEGNDQSEVTQPTLYKPAQITREYALDLYVGGARLTAFQELFLSHEEWAHAWDTDAGVKGEFSTENFHDVWACDDALVDEFVRLTAVLKAQGEPLEKLNAIAQGVAGVTNIKLANNLAMGKVIQQFEEQHRFLSHQARMALQAPLETARFANDTDDYYNDEPIADDMPFDR